MSSCKDYPPTLRYYQRSVTNNIVCTVSKRYTDTAPVSFSLPQISLVPRINSNNPSISVLLPGEMLPKLISKSGLHENNIRSIIPSRSFEFRANFTSILNSERVPRNWRTLPLIAEHIAKHCWPHCFDDVMNLDSRKCERLEMIQICWVIIKP